MSKYYFYESDDEMCLTLEYIKDKIHDEGLKEKEVFEADIIRGDAYFYCRHYSEVGEKGDCGRQCKFYDPRNKISGICKHSAPVYEHGKKILISLEK